MTRAQSIHRKYRAFLFAAFFSLIAVSAGVLPSGPAMAQSLQDLRASGAVGEGYDGFVHMRDGGSSVASVIAAINAKRQALYTSRATEQGTSVDLVGRVYAGEIRGKAAPGTWFLSENGSWTQK